MKDALIVSALSLVPRNRGARVMGHIARSGASRLLMRAFVRAYRVDLSEAEGEISDYPTLEALFTRRLKPGARPIDMSARAVVSPVDGCCAFSGRSVRGQIEVAPGRTLALSELLAWGNDAGLGESGELDVAVLYLSPTDYHRVHVPCDGIARSWRYVPGTLWPVFPAAVRRVDNLFARNERVVVEIETERGPLFVVLVGAFGVGRITLSVCDLVTNSGGHNASGLLEAPVQRGADLGVFHLGSTVVLCSEPGRFSFDVRAGDRVRVGQRIGTIAGLPQPG